MKWLLLMLVLINANMLPALDIAILRDGKVQILRYDTDKKVVLKTRYIPVPAGYDAVDARIIANSKTVLALQNLKKVIMILRDKGTLISSGDVSFSADGSYYASLKDGLGEVYSSVDNAHPIKTLNHCTNAIFSPRKAEMAITTTDEASHLSLLSLPDMTSSTIESNAEAMAWAPDGEHVLYKKEKDGDGNDHLYIYSLTKQRSRFIIALVNTIDPVFSPDMRYLAIHSHMSRPVSGHIIVDLATKKIVPDPPEIKGYTPALIEAWSADGKQILCRYRKIDPMNDGSWLQEEVWVVSFQNRKATRLGVCRNRSKFEFIADSDYVMWIDPKSDLLISPIRGGKKIVATQTTDFAILQEGDSWE